MDSMISSIEAMLKKDADVQSAHEFLIGKKWIEKNGIFYSLIKSDGKTGLEWERSLEADGHEVSLNAKSVLRSQKFQPTNKTVYLIAVLKFNFRATIKIIEERALELGFYLPHPEIGCLIREKFSDNQISKMGFEAIVVMHDYINNCLLSTLRNTLTAPHIIATSEYNRFDSAYGFAYCAAMMHLN